MTLRPLTPAQIARGCAAFRRLYESYLQGRQAASLDRWWQREIKGRYLGEV